MGCAIPHCWKRRAALTLARALIVAAVAGLPCASVAAAVQDNRPAKPVVNAPKTGTIPPAPAADTEVQNNPPPAGGDDTGGVVWQTVREQVLSLAILAFGTVVLVVQYLLLRKPTRDPSSILQLLSINLIVTGTLFLITAGFDAQSIAPGLGLFGTIAGYVLGRRSSDDGNDTPPKSGTGHDQP